MKGHRLLATAIVVWTGVAWGGRIGLLSEGGDFWVWARIVGSILVALVVAGTLVVDVSHGWRIGAVGAFVVWTLALWSPSTVINWVGDGSLAFKLVHTVLSAGFFALVWWAIRQVRLRPGPK